MAKQRGVALIIVLLIVAIVSVLATEMGARLQLQVKRAANIKDNNQAYWYAIGAEHYARKSIVTLVKESDGIIHLNQPWAEPFLFPIEGGGIEAQLIDMQACFNLNGLRDSTSANSTVSASRSTELSARLEAFQRLIGLVNTDIASYTIETVRDSVADWLDADDNMSQLGAEDSEYESRDFPYMAANSFMADKTELRLINGVELSWLPDLLKKVCVVPSSNQFVLNVNTVSEEDTSVLAALTGLTESEASAVVSARPLEGFKNKDDFLAVNQLSAKNLSDEQKAWFDITTQYFILQTKVRYNNATFAMKTVFKVDNQNVTVVRREFGGF